MHDALNEARILLASLPMFAQGLAGKFGVTVTFDRRAGTAKTDGKRIILPQMPLPESDQDAQAAIQLARLGRGFIVHEVGHVRHTDFDVARGDLAVLNDRLLKSLWNAIEDPWQEDRLIREFRGARMQLDEMTEALIGHPNFYSVLTEDMDPMWLVSAYTLYMLRGGLRDQKAFDALAEASRPAVVNTFGEAFVSRLEVLVDVHGPKLDSTKSTLALAQRIKAAMEEEEQKKREEEQPPSTEQDQEEDEQSTSDADADGDADQDTDQNDDEQQGNGKSNKDDTDDQGSDDGSDGGPSSDEDDGAAAGQGGDNDAQADGGGNAQQQADALKDALSGYGRQVEDLSDAVAREIEQGCEEIEQNGVVGYVRDDPSAQVEMPEGGATNRALSTGHFDPTPALRQSGRLRMVMQNELQSLQLMREHESVRGSVLNQRKVHRTGSGDRRLFVHIDEVRRLNTAVFFLADVSGSMSGDGGVPPILLESQALYASAAALGSLTGVSTAIGTFPGFGMVQRFGERVTSIQGNFGLRAHGTTPMAEGILWASRQLLARREERKLLIVTTDGAPDNHGTARAQILACERMGIETMGLGIQLPMISTLFEKHAVISSIDELSGAMLSMVRGALKSQLQVA